MQSASFGAKGPPNPPANTETAKIGKAGLPLTRHEPKHSRSKASQHADKPATDFYLAGGTDALNNLNKTAVGRLEAHKTLLATATSFAIKDGNLKKKGMSGGHHGTCVRPLYSVGKAKIAHGKVRCQYLKTNATK